MLSHKVRFSSFQIILLSAKQELNYEQHNITTSVSRAGRIHMIMLICIEDGLKHICDVTVLSADKKGKKSFGVMTSIMYFSPKGHRLACGSYGKFLLIGSLHGERTGNGWGVDLFLLKEEKRTCDFYWKLHENVIIFALVVNFLIALVSVLGSVHQLLDGHFHYVQGVAWDPLAKYIASISSDRTCRVYVNKPQTKTKGAEKMNYVSQHVIMKAEQQMSTKTHLFHDETLPSFFRRLAWSPDGSFLLVPAGMDLNRKCCSTSETWIMSNRNLLLPAVMLPGASKPVVAVRFCPVPFSLRGLASDGLFKLPYRLIFAVATLNSLYIYDTESVPPIAILAGLHYAAITDISWSSNAQYLALSSRDGYCTLVEFEANELGSPTSFADERKDAVHQNKSPDAQEPECMIIETTKNNGCIAADSGKTVVTNNEGKQPSPISTSTPISNKPGKRRITPMAIDPQQH
ncbi:hypothetical protein SADUNF_Sadunf07G0093500 [Salix dunnii]|uniref:CAF1B/HIR1 beta-propeller domain-containing protein n=1 Tax=Salix dunnii TaxID=1413687 RepID=A0A835K5T4_9ROSI|nr:hypothetical protein SADUNF_Sadunf07G0093500 [Salix dunnii]